MKRAVCVVIRQCSVVLGNITNAAVLFDVVIEHASREPLYGSRDKECQLTNWRRTRKARFLEEIGVSVQDQTRG